MGKDAECDDVQEQLFGSFDGFWGYWAAKGKQCKVCICSFSDVLTCAVKGEQCTVCICIFNDV